MHYVSAHMIDTSDILARERSGLAFRGDLKPCAGRFDLINLRPASQVKVRS